MVGICPKMPLELWEFFKCISVKMANIHGAVLATAATTSSQFYYLLDSFAQTTVQTFRVPRS